MTYSMTKAGRRPLPAILGVGLAQAGRFHDVADAAGAVQELFQDGQAAVVTEATWIGCASSQSHRSRPAHRVP
jgi:hypothetical protein